MSYLFEALRLPISAEDSNMIVYWEDPALVDALCLETEAAVHEFIIDTNELMEYCYV